MGGIGWQELFIIGACGMVVVLAAVVALVMTRTRGRRSDRP